LCASGLLDSPDPDEYETYNALKHEFGFKFDHYESFVEVANIIKEFSIQIGTAPILLLTDNFLYCIFYTCQD
jgi:hypothetical protein